MPESDYQTLVQRYAELVGKHTIQNDTSSLQRLPSIADNARCVLLFSPHPDDECIVGGLPLRLLHELKMNVTNVAVTQGSNKARQSQRWQEVSNACDYLGFKLISTVINGLENINFNTRTEKPQQWAKAVDVISKIILDRKPKVIFMPHAVDNNSTHIGTHYLIVDALAQCPEELSCFVVETEFWSTMAKPNLMVESSIAEVTDLVTALAMHKGEIERNPYHLRLPAWFIDNVRRGSEVVGEQGAAAVDFTFATLYRLRRWSQGGWQEVLEPDKGLVLSSNDDLNQLFKS